MDIFFLIICFLFNIWLLASFLICIYWLCKPATLSSFNKSHRRTAITINIGAFLCCSLFIFGTLKSTLWYIPEGWVYKTDKGDIGIVRDAVAIIIALPVTIILALKFEEFQKMHRDIEKLENEAEQESKDEKKVKQD
ncbi:hypothetical protein JW962_03300 [Candidatus Dojkabacteria bacterium]|nr:hypothetical protein [Candidatus Dojkabacteria bacterium]